MPDHALITKVETLIGTLFSRMVANLIDIQSFRLKNIAQKIRDNDVATNCTPLRQMALLLPYQLKVFTPSAAAHLLKPNTRNYLSSISQKVFSFHVKKEQVFQTWTSSLMLILNSLVWNAT